MILSINAEKAFDKIQHPFLVKTLQSVGIKGIQIGKEEVKLSSQMTWHFMWKTQKTPPPKLLELIKQFSNMAGYKINAQNQLLSYTLTL